MVACLRSIVASLLLLLLVHGGHECTNYGYGAPLSESSSDRGLQLLQLKAKPTRSSAGDGEDLAAEARSPTDTDWDSAKAALLQLQEVAEGHSTVLNGAVNSSAREAPSELVAMRGVLEGLYNDSKGQISQLTSRDRKSKQHFVEQQAVHKARIEALEARRKNGALSNESYADLTAEENRMWDYWQKVREREHRQYLSFLNIKHGMLDKMKAMIELYTKTIAGYTDAGNETAATTGDSHLFLFQSSDAPRALARFCREALVDVHAGRHQMA